MAGVCGLKRGFRVPVWRDAGETGFCEEAGGNGKVATGGVVENSRVWLMVTRFPRSPCARTPGCTC